MFFGLFRAVRAVMIGLRSCLLSQVSVLLVWQQQPIVESVHTPLGCPVIVSHDGGFNVFGREHRPEDYPTKFMLLNCFNHGARVEHARF